MNEKDIWALIDKLMKKNGLVQSQIDSFNNNFIDALPEYNNKEGHMMTFI
jgi:DNA-directed RNA polymerase beta subunit